METHKINTKVKALAYNRYTEIVLLFFLAVILSIILSSCSSMDNSAAQLHKQESMEDRFGIKVESLRLSAADSIIDFRYRIIDPQKATRLAAEAEHGGHNHGGASSTDPYLIDKKSGIVLAVPKAAKIGPLRQSPESGSIKANRVYFVLFGNANRLVKAGDKVDIVIGEFKVANLTIE